MKFRPVKATEVDVRVGMTRNGNKTLLLYKDARVDMTILDETVGALSWKREHKESTITSEVNFTKGYKGVEFLENPMISKKTLTNGNCIVSIWNDAIKEWVSKEDTGTESNTEAEKGVASDSFKRACVNWGIGRELYTCMPISIKDNGNKYQKFIVSKLVVEEGQIIQIAINEENFGKVGKVVFKAMLNEGEWSFKAF